MIPAAIIDFEEPNRAVRRDDILLVSDREEVFVLDFSHQLRERLARKFTMQVDILLGVGRGNTRPPLIGKADAFAGIFDPQNCIAVKRCHPCHAYGITHT